MNNPREDFQTVYQARSGAAEISIAVKRVDIAGFHRRQFTPTFAASERRRFFDRAPHVEAARHKQNHVWLCIDDGLPFDLERWFALATQRIEHAGKRDDPWH